MDKFNDFIIGDFIDSYRNLTFKTFTGYKYFNEYCLNIEKKLVLMHDDDTLINEAHFNSHFVNFNNLEMVQKVRGHIKLRNSADTYRQYHMTNMQAEFQETRKFLFSRLNFSPKVSF